MLAHKRAGKTRAGLTAAMLSGKLEIYVCAPGAYAATLALAENLAGTLADAGGALYLPYGGILIVVRDAPENLYDRTASVTLDEPSNPDLFSAALHTAQNNNCLRVVASAGKQGSLIHQLSTGSLFRVYVTDITRSAGMGFPWSPDWAWPLESRSSPLYRQEYLCIHNPNEPVKNPALHFYSVVFGHGQRVCVPGTSRADAMRVYNLCRKERPPAISASLSNDPILCGDCRGGSAVYVLAGQPHRYYCEAHAQERMAAGASGYSLYRTIDARTL